MSAPTPTIIAGRYELQRRLAQGGMAEVWLAIDLTLDRKVAVKWLKPTLATDPVVAERFRREAVAAASLNHPNIVAVHDVFEQDGRQAVVMQLVDGKSLRQLLDTQKRLSPELTCHIGTGVALALDTAHEAGFVHRDVKPGNIMITPDGRVLLTDFGIAKGLHGDGSDDLTSDNIMMGTAKYLSPEQVRGKKLDGRADLYSLGLVLYECLAGRVPFLGESDADTALARLQRDPTDLARLRATLPHRLVAVIHNLLERKPEKRPSSGAELIAELRAAQEEGPPEFDPTNEERSPVAPFSAGRLLRAPSDSRGRATDRSRAVRRPTPPRGQAQSPVRGRVKNPATRSDPQTVSGPEPDVLITGPVGIPGEPPIITGRHPVTTPTTQTPSTRVATTRADAPPPVHRDPTPPAGHQRGAPARGMQQQWGPSTWFVGILILIAVVVAIIVWLNATFGGTNSTTDTTVLPNVAGTVASVTDAAPTDGDAVGDADAAADGEAADAVGADPAADPGADSGEPAQIRSIVAFDPEGDDRSENDQLAPDALADEDPSTEWHTVCYSGEYINGKRGVGLIVSLDAPTDSPLRVEVTNGPYQVQFFASANETPPSTIDGWGSSFDRSNDTEGAMLVTEAPPAGTRHMLVLLNQIGPNAGCSDANPYRTGLAEIELVN